MQWPAFRTGPQLLQLPSRSTKMQLGMIWLMVPAGVVDATLRDLAPKLESGDIVIDGGNSYYIDDIRRAKELSPKGIHYVDVGTSGGVWGLERGHFMMLGGEPGGVGRLGP